jgi:hypothetical protein
MIAAKRQPSQFGPEIGIKKKAPHETDGHRREQHRHDERGPEDLGAGEVSVKQQREADTQRDLNNDRQNGENAGDPDGLPKARVGQGLHIIVEPDEARRREGSERLVAEGQIQGAQDRQREDKHNQKPCRQNEFLGKLRVVGFDASRLSAATAI